MCWSKAVSRNFAIIGLLGSLYAIKNKFPIHVITLYLFYTLMEITQYIQYDTLGSCSEKNAQLTKWAWILVWIQPFMWNWYFLKTTTGNKEIFKYTMIFSFIVFIFGIMRIFGPYKGPYKTHELSIEGKNCAEKGKLHYGWKWKAGTYKGIEPNWFVYLLSWMLPIAFLKPNSQRLPTFVSIFAGLFTHIIYNGEPNFETPTIWCLTVIGFALGSVLMGNSPIKLQNALK